MKMAGFGLFTPFIFSWVETLKYCWLIAPVTIKNKHFCVSYNPIIAGEKVIAWFTYIRNTLP